MTVENDLADRVVIWQSEMNVDTAAEQIPNDYSGRDDSEAKILTGFHNKSDCACEGAVNGHMPAEAVNSERNEGCGWIVHKYKSGRTCKTHRNTTR